MTVLDRFLKNTKFHENPSSGSRVVRCGRTDRHDDANSRFSKFCESAYKRVPIHQPVAILPEHLRSTVLPLCRFSIPILMSLTLKSIFMSSTCRNVRPLTRCAAALKYTFAFTPSAMNSSTSDARRLGLVESAAPPVQSHCFIWQLSLVTYLPLVIRGRLSGLR